MTYPQIITLNLNTLQFTHYLTLTLTHQIYQLEKIHRPVGKKITIKQLNKKIGEIGYNIIIYIQRKFVKNHIEIFF